MKKILCFSSSLSGGGAQRQIAILANFLLKEGYDVSVATYNNYEDRYNIHKGVKRIRIPAKGSNIRKIFIISRYVRKLDTDCIISYRSPVNFILLLSMLFSRKPKILVGERNLTIKPSFREKVNYYLLYHRAHAIITNSHSQEDYLKSLNFSWKRKVVTITNYTDLNFFTPQKIDFSRPYKIAIFSRFSKQKNCIRFAEAVKELVNRGNKDFSIHWYGDMTGKNGVIDQHYVAFKQKILDLNIESFLIIHPSTENVNVEMEKYHVICLPSLYEGFSNSISEGICCGKPMLVSNVSDNPIMVEEGVNGFLFNPTSINSIVEAFEKMFSQNSIQLEKMGVNSRKKAESLFDEKIFVNQYVKLIEE